MRTFKDKSYEKFHKDILHPLFNRQFLSKLEIHDKNVKKLLVEFEL